MQELHKQCNNISVICLNRKNFKKFLSFAKLIYNVSHCHCYRKLIKQMFFAFFSSKCGLMARAGRVQAAWQQPRVSLGLSKDGFKRFSGFGKVGCHPLNHCTFLVQILQFCWRSLIQNVSGWVQCTLHYQKFTGSNAPSAPILTLMLEPLWLSNIKIVYLPLSVE